MLKYFLKNFAVILLSLSLVSNCWAGVDFDGTDDSVNMDDIAAIDALTNMSGFVVVKFDTQTTDDGLIGKMISDGTNGWIFFRDDVGASGRTDCFNILLADSTGTDSVRVESATNSAVADTWYRVIFTWEQGSTTGLHLYIDGVEDVNSPANSSTIAAVDAGTAVFDIGRSSLTNKWQDGIITEVALWNSVLTAQEISILSNSYIKGMPLQIQPANLVGYWPMDDQETGTSADADTVRDLSGNGNNGTGDNGANNTGLAWTGESVLSYPPSIIGQ